MTYSVATQAWLGYHHSPGASCAQRRGCLSHLPSQETNSVVPARQRPDYIHGSSRPPCRVPRRPGGILVQQDVDGARVCSLVVWALFLVTPWLHVHVALMALVDAHVALIALPAYSFVGHTLDNVSAPPSSLPGVNWPSYTELNTVA